uniref:Gustatory receptor n=1 Tax=Tetranychus urticae TaxID=32264 RepID=T1K844_TETUR
MIRYISNNNPINFKIENKNVQLEKSKIVITNFYLQHVYKSSKLIKFTWNIAIIIFVVNRLMDRYFSYQQNLIKFDRTNQIYSINILLGDLWYFYMLSTHDWLYNSVDIEKINKLWHSIDLPVNYYNQNFISSRRSKASKVFMLIIGLVFCCDAATINMERYPNYPKCTFIHNLISILINYYATVMTFTIHSSLLVEMTILISASFNHINRFIGGLGSSQQLTNLHQMHTKTIQLTHRVNSMFTNFIIYLYPASLFRVTTIIYSFMFQPISTIAINLNLLSVIKFVNPPIFIIFITLSLSAVHQFSYNCSNHLYYLTHRSLPDDIKYQVATFLYRVDRKDIGFTFWKLALIGPSFSSSMTTLLLITIIVLSAINYLY